MLLIVVLILPFFVMFPDFHGVVNLYGQDVVRLAKAPVSYNNIVFIKISQQDWSQIDIYIGNPGNPNVYKESIFKQGNVQPQSSVLVDREYLTPNSTLEIQLQPVDVNETNFMATIEISNVQNPEIIITNTFKTHLDI